MRILITADIHSNVENVRQLARTDRDADVVLVAGDIVSFEGVQKAKQILRILAGCGKRLLAIAGNCDLPETSEFLKNSDCGAEERAVKIEDYIFIGAGKSLLCPSKTPNETTEENLKNILDTIAEQNDGRGSKTILITHQPAFGTKLDQPAPGVHTGSRAIREFIEKYRPVLAVSGHIHEAHGVDKIGDTTVVNPGPLKIGRYATAELDGKTVGVELKSLW